MRERPAPEGWSEPLSDFVRGANGSASKPSLSARQGIHNLVGTVSFFACWRDGIAARIEAVEQGDQPIDELYDLPEEVAAFTRTVCAFQRDWRAQ